MRKQKQNKWQKIVAINLAHYRLQGDVYALSAEIDENKPLENSVKAEGVFERVWGILTTGVRNEFRRNVAVGLQEELDGAKKVLAAFEARNEKLLKYGESEEKFKKLIEKKLFKKDKYGLERMRYALAFIVRDENEYCRAEESLQVVSELLFQSPMAMGELREAFLENYRKLIDEKKSVELEDFLPAWAREMLGIFTVLGGASEKKRSTQQAATETENQFAAALSFELTVLGEGMKSLPEQTLKEELDEFLKRLSNYRADAEYRWLVERGLRETSGAKILVCNRSVERLSELLGV